MAVIDPTPGQAKMPPRKMVFHTSGASSMPDRLYSKTSSCINAPAA